MPEPEQPRRESNRRALDRRQFASLLPALLAAGTVLPLTLLQESATAQQAGTMEHPIMGEPTPGFGRPEGSLPQLVSGVYTPSPPHGTQRVGRTFLDGMLKAGNIQMEIHETTQEPGTPHEAIGHHLHNEIWLVREGICELTTNGVTRRMVAGDVGLCCAGDLHYVANAGNTKCSYFVVTVGPPEPTS